MLIFLLIATLSACTKETPIPIKENNEVHAVKKIIQSIEDGDLRHAADFASEVDNFSKNDKQKIINALAECINKDHLNAVSSFANKNTFISETTISKFERYLQLINSINITDNDDTSVDDYVYSILTLNEYSEYNDLWTYYNESKEYWEDGNYYFNLATNTNSDYIKKDYLNKAKEKYNMCITIIDNYSYFSYGIAENYSMASTYIDVIDAHLSSRTITFPIADTADDYRIVMNKLSTAGTEVLSVLKGLPSNVY